MSTSRRTKKSSRKRQTRRKAVMAASLAGAILVALFVIDFLFSLAGYDPVLHEPKDFDRTQVEDSATGRPRP